MKSAVAVGFSLHRKRYFFQNVELSSPIRKYCSFNGPYPDASVLDTELNAWHGP